MFRNKAKGGGGEGLQTCTDRPLEMRVQELAGVCSLGLLTAVISTL